MLVPAMVLLAASCGGSDNKSSSSTSKPGHGGGKPKAKTLRIYASLDAQPLVAALAGTFERSVKGYKAKVTYVKFSELQNDISTGKADVVVTNGIGMKALDKSVDLKADPVLIGWDEMVIAVAKGNPKKIESVSVFGADANTTSVVCSGKTPCGTWTARVLVASHVTPAPDHSSDLPQQMLKDIAAGRSDAAMLRRSVAATMPLEVDQVPIPVKQNVRLVYRAGVVTAAGASTRFAFFLKSPAAKAAIRARGYLPRVAAAA